MQNAGSDPFWIRALLIMLPGLLAPLVTWLSSLRGDARRDAELGRLLRRMELIERVQRLQGEAADGRQRQRLEEEIADVLEDLAVLRGPEVTLRPGSGVARVPWREWLLAYEQASLKGRVYRGLFHLFLAFGLLGSVGIMLTFGEPTEGVSGWEAIVLGLFGASFYLAVGLAFRAAAVRDYRRRMEKAAAHRGMAVGAAG